MQTALDLDVIVQATGLSADEILHNKSVIVNAFDHGHIVVFWNEAAVRYFGITEKDALGKKLEDLLPETKQDERISWLDRCLDGQEMHLLNGEFRRRRGKYEQKIIPARDADGKVCAAINVVKTL